jgi:hypothetical protein
MKTLLFAPASRPTLIEKAAASAADAVCLDLEDSVAPAEKAAGREHVVRALRELDFGGRTRVVRINGLDTPYAYRDLVDVVEAAGDRIDLVMVPKVGGPRDVAFVDTLLSQIEWHRQQRTPIRIEAQIETAAGFLYARDIATASPRLDALIFGPGDYAASMQMPSSGIGEHDENDALYPGHRWHAGHAYHRRRRARTWPPLHGRTVRRLQRSRSAWSDRVASHARSGSTASSASTRRSSTGKRDLHAERGGRCARDSARAGVRRSRRLGPGRRNPRRPDDRCREPADGANGPAAGALRARRRTIRWL